MHKVAEDAAARRLEAAGVADEELSAQPQRRQVL
jgi:hypothetical protein